LPEARLKRLAVLVLLLVAGSLAVPGQESGGDPIQQARLKRLFPAATAFSAMHGDPLHLKAFSGDTHSGNPTLLGLAFLTTDVDPLERGYDGPIKILVGMDTTGILTGIIVVEHHEPYGEFSLDRPKFAAQFKGKSVRDSFRVGVDIDAVSRATISVTSASRTVRNSARMVARRLLVPSSESGKQ
jgi:NosR/NirI family transcriptional regulator, nitrous oxide reductase regulator